MAVSVVMNDAHGDSRLMYVKLVSAEVNNVSGASSYGVFRGFSSKDSSDSGAAHHVEIMIKCIVDVSSSPWEQIYSAFIGGYGGESV